MIKGVLFDKDGTLIEFEKTWHSIMTIIFNNLSAECGFSQEQIHLLKEVSGYTPYGFKPESLIQYLPTSQIIEVWLQSLQIKEHDIIRLRRLFTNIFEKSTTDEKVDVSLLPTTKETLSYLSEKSYKLGIATADTKESMEYSLKKADIYHYFDYFGSDDGQLKGKPDPHMALEFCKRNGFKPEELLVVGDSISDKEFAFKSGAQFLGIVNDYGAFSSDNRAEKTFRLVRRLEEIIKVKGL